MTVAELYESVAQLGFEDSLEYEKGFLRALNRALLQVNSLRPATNVYVINHRPLKNELRSGSFSPIERTQPLCFEATDVKSYYFEACGVGYAIIEAKSEDEWAQIGEVNFSSTAGFTAHRGFIKNIDEFVSGEVRIRFEGEYLYTVKNVAMYKHILSANEEDIPAYEPHTRYDISAIVGDFLSLACPPVIYEGAEARYLDRYYDVENGRVILLPYNRPGIYKVVYNRKPRAVTEDELFGDKSTIIDLDEELCALLPVLIASYVWADDEPQKAEYYLTLYRERAADIESRVKNVAPVQMRSVNGW